jgi:uncharacterized protein YcaQ
VSIGPSQSGVNAHGSRVREARERVPVDRASSLFYGIGMTRGSSQHGKHPLTPDLSVSARDARRFLLAHQGLLPPRALEGEHGALEYLRRVRCVQFDPLDVVGRNPELVLQARVHGFRRELLERLLYRRRRLVDGWDKQMSVWPVEDWPGFHRERRDARARYDHAGSSTHRVVPMVRAAFVERGPLSSLDVEGSDKVPWPWGPARAARAAMESMWWWGELVVCRRVHTRKVYDLAVRRLPRRILETPDPHESREAHHDWRVKRRLRGIGMLWNRSGDAWLGIDGVKSPERTASLERLRARGEVLAVAVNETGELFYIAREDEPLLCRVSRAGSGEREQAAILAPLDNLLWDRRMMRALFGFEYVWEVYKPVNERRFGYYVLPVLYGERFVARFEPGRDDNGSLLIRRWWWEAELRPTDRMRAALRRCFREFREYLGAPGIRLERPLARDLEWLRLP